MKYPLDSLKNPKVVLDLDGYLAANPDEAAELGDVVIIPYRPGASRPTYSMCDTVAMVARQDDDLNLLFMRAKRAAPLAYQAIFYGKGVGIYGSRENTCAVCVDRSIRRGQVHLC